MAVDPSSALRSGGLTLDLDQKEKKRTSEATGLSRLTRSLGKTHTVSAQPHAIWVILEYNFVLPATFIFSCNCEYSGLDHVQGHTHVGLGPIIIIS